MNSMKVSYYSDDVYCSKVAEYLDSIQEIADESEYDSWVDEIIITPLPQSIDRVLVVVKVCAMKEAGMK